MKALFYSFLLLFYSYPLIAQPGIEWAKNLSTTRSIPNGIIVGPANSYYSAGRLGGNAWAARVNESFDIIWEHNSLGGSALDAIQGGKNQLIQTPDGGLLMCGYSTSGDGYLSNNYGDHDGWIIKLNKEGDIVWSKNYGTDKYDICTGLLNAPEGGYYGMFESVGQNNDFTLSYGDMDIWVTRMDGAGNFLWKKQFGGSDRDYGHSWVMSPNGNITIAARSESADIDLAGTEGTPALWLFQIDPNGNLVWSKTYAGLFDLFSLSSSNDNGFIACGKAFSSSTYFGNNGGHDGFVMKFNSDGSLDWAKNYGGSENDGFASITPLSDGNYLAVGTSISDDGDVNSQHGKGDAWVIKISPKGQILWSRTLGGTNGDAGVAAIEVNKQEFIVLIYNGSFDGDFRDPGVRPGPTIVKLNEQLSNNAYANLLDFRIIPTPVLYGDHINIELPDTDEYLVQLFDISGKLSYKKVLAGTLSSIPTNMLKPGMYMYYVQKGERVAIGKLLIFE
jgi:hypothetical protein